MFVRVLLTTLALATLSAMAMSVGRASPPPAAAAVHPRLLSSEPGRDDTLTVSPDRVRLLFSAPVQVSLSSVEVVGEGRELTLTVNEAPDTVNGLVAELPMLPSGTYRVSWRTVSADGHAVTGAYSFTLTLPERSATVPDESRTHGGEPAGGEPDGGTVADGGGATETEPPSPGVAAALRGLGDGFLLALAGLTLFLGWLTPGAGTRPERLARFFAWVTPVVLVVALVAWIVTVVTGELSYGGIAAALGTLPGRLGTIRIGLVVFALLALTAMRSVRVAALLSLAAVLLGSGIGHAATFHPLWSVPSKAIHLAASSIWLGGLIVLLTDESEGQGFADHAGVVSTWALASVIAIALTGTVQTLFMVPELGLLLTSDWGTMVILKLIGLLVLVGFGAYHRLKVLPRMALEGGPSLRASVRWETLVMLAVILTAAFLSRTEPPDTHLAGTRAVAEQLLGR